MSIKRGLVAAEKFDAGDVVAHRRLGWVNVLSFDGGVRGAGEGAPGLDEVEVAVIGAMGVGGADVGIVERHLGGDEGGFEGDEASLTPTDICQLVDEGFFHVIGGGERGADAGDVEEEIGFIFNGEDDVDGGGEAVFQGVGAGDGFALGGDGAFGFGSVDAGLLRASEFGGCHLGSATFLAISWNGEMPDLTVLSV